MARFRDRTIGRPEGPDCAAGILEGPEFRLVWCNRVAYTLFDKPYRSDAALGLPLEQINPILFAAQGSALREAMVDGKDRSGTDRMFSVERGITIFHWSLRQLGERQVLALVHIERAKP